MTDYESHVRDAFPELDAIEDDELRRKIVELWVLALERAGWKDVHDIPHTWNIHEATTVEHLRGVCKIAVASAEIQRDFHGADPDFDLVRAIALTHDVGKCFEYTVHVDDEKLDDPDPEYVGDLIPHQLSGAALAQEVGLPQAVRHAIPHGKYEIPERTLEAELIESANDASSNAMTMATMGMPLRKWTEEYH